MKKQIIITSAAIIVSIVACRKAKDNTDNNSSSSTTAPTSSQVLKTFVNNTAIVDYEDIYNHAQQFQTACNSFYANANDNDLATMRTHWYGMRKAYENGESFLIGPISTQNYDPEIDSWPVEQHQLDSILNSANDLTDPGYIASLPTTLIGFHPVEYLIFGRANAAAFTQRQKDYLKGLTSNLVDIVVNINNSYNTSVSGNYATVLTTIPNSTYSSRKAALLDLANAMSDICNEVGGNASDGKIYSVYSTQDTLLQESLFSRNSWTDFTNNMKGVWNVYAGTYGGTSADPNSLSALIAARNISLDNSIKTSINNAVGSFSGAHQNFSQSVYSERTQCQNIMTAIDSLKNTIDNKLIPFINQYITD